MDTDKIQNPAEPSEPAQQRAGNRRRLQTTGAVATAGLFAASASPATNG